MENHMLHVAPFTTFLEFERIGWNKINHLVFIMSKISNRGGCVNIKGALSRRLCCILGKTAQTFDRKSPLLHRIALSAAGRKYEMIQSPRKNKL